MASQSKRFAPLVRNTNQVHRWIIIRKAIQWITLIGFLFTFIITRSGGATEEINVFLKIDPLVILANLISSRTFRITSSLALIIILSSLLVGRAWCGWLCPLGSIFDLTTPKNKRNSRFAIPDSFRKIKYVLLFFILASALFGNLTFLFLDPLTLLYRSLVSSIWPALDQIITQVETILYSVRFLQDPIASFDTWLRPNLLPQTPLFYRQVLVYALIFFCILALNWIVPRFWCRYLCPLGGLLGLMSKFSLLRRQVGEDCRNCALCSRECPTGTIDPNRGYSSDPSECTLCLGCFEACPRSSISLTPIWKMAEWREYDPGRREVLGALTAGIASVAVFRSSQSSIQPNPQLIRPPGTQDPEFISKCIRCGICMRVCPTSAIQPSAFEAGLEGLWTPLLVPRLGYCDYSCNACGQVCPVKAIPALDLEVKRQQVIGKAYIDTNRCIAWSDHNNCIVCEEMCPLPEKAVQLMENEWTDENGQKKTIKVPYVLRDRCIGCGICEYKCPVKGTAAIRVFTPTIIQSS